MKRSTFVILMAVLGLLLGSVLFALWRTFLRPAPQAVPAYISDEIHQEEIQESEPEGIHWEDKRIEVGKLTYTITRASYLTNLENGGRGKFRENAVVGIYDGTGSDPTVYYYPNCFDATDTLVSGACMVLLDVQVDSQDAVNFRTNKATGVQSRRYEDNPFLFRADEIAYLIDTSEDATHGYTYYDAVFFTEMNGFSEHPMAYEVLPGESVTFRIGFLLGNLPDGTQRDLSKLVISTAWNDPEEEYFELNLK